MNTFRTIAFAAAVAIGTVIGSLAPANAGQFDWLSNKGYTDCLKMMSWAAEGGGIWGGKKRYGAERDAAYDRGRRKCNRQYYPNHKGYDY
jgi:hypothetical protein